MEIDVRNLICPQPLIRVKKHLDTGDCGAFDIIFSDNTEGNIAVENVSRFLRKNNREFTAADEPGIKRIRVSAGNGAIAVREPEPTSCSAFQTENGIMTAVIKSDVIGSDEKELGRILMHSFFRTLPEAMSEKNRAVFLNSGVKLAVVDSEFLSDLEELEKKGFELYVCGTCLDYFSLKPLLKVGKVSNMMEIVTLIKESGSVICLT